MFSKENTDVFKVVDVTHGTQRVWTYNAHLVRGEGQEVSWNFLFIYHLSSLDFRTNSVKRIDSTQYDSLALFNLLRLQYLDGVSVRIF